MNYIYYSESSCSDYLAHHGILGQKWGIRRFQNKDGTLTAEGKRRYGKLDTVGESVAKGAKAVGLGIAKGATTIGKGVGRGVTTVGKGVGYVGKGIGRGIGMQVAKRAPFMLSNEAMEKYRTRLELDNKYRQLLEDRKAMKRRNKGESFVKKILQNSATTLANKAVNKMADEMLKTDDERRREAFKLQNETRLNALRSTIFSDEKQNQADNSKINQLVSENKKSETKVKDLQRKLSTTSSSDPSYLSIQNQIESEKNKQRKNGYQIDELKANVKSRKESIKDRRDIIGSHK